MAPVLQMLASLRTFVLLIHSGSSITRRSASGFVPVALNTKGRVRSWLRDTHSRFAQKLADDSDEVDPTKFWFTRTDPFIVYRHFAIERITDDRLKDVLRFRGIRTLEDLQRKIFEVEYFLEKATISQFSQTVVDANNRYYETAESFLSGQLVYDERTLMEKAYETYSKDAVAVTPLEIGSRNFSFTMVLGPNGSGKTMFALRRLPSLIFTGGENTMFRVHFHTNVAHRMISSSVAFPGAVASYVESCITNKLSASCLTNVTTVNLNLHVILDTAGSVSYKPCFDSASKILDIVDALRNKMLYKFTKKIHVTLVGAGLELSTLAIDSKTETTKFRILPWTVDNFEKMIDAANYYHYQQIVKRVVRSFPILTSLVTNARCAFILFRHAMPELYLLEKQNFVKGSLNEIISKVAYNYKDLTRLRALRLPKEKWAVVRSVFREIDKATDHPNLAFLPRFEDVDPYFFSVPLSMVDIHVESEHGLPVLRSNTYSVSLSPALFIVFATLLNANADLSWDWQTFQSTVAMGEWKRMIVQSRDTPTHDDRTIVQMPFAIPSTNAKKTMIIPRMNQFMVVMNVPSASYADIIAPFRLTRATFRVAATTVTHQSLDLQSELDKMGLTNSSKHKKQQALTSVLYQDWNSTERAPTETSVDEKQWANQHERNMYFPSDEVVSEFSFETPTLVKCRIQDGCVIVGKHRTELLVPFEDGRPLTAVFVTNCRAFELQVKKLLPNIDLACYSLEKLEAKKKTKTSIDAAEKFKIDWDDVDCQGKLKSKILPDNAVFGLREHVEIRFVFVNRRALIENDECN